ncbi:MAG: Divergent AAA domain protein [Syntrophorhabdus sp. PtaU1.Bin050]|nr:MAG: Divergent AAA domain protein [Syntrophorhabdus sp. PtaU1.Bin050]
MSQEGHLVDKKSLRAVMNRGADWDGLAKDCVAFANAVGGHLLIGIEDDAETPPLGQRVAPELPDQLRRKIAERTVNVAIFPEIRQIDEGGQYIDLYIPRSPSVASTSDGRYYLRIADQSKPVIGDEVMRLATERASFPWETLATLEIPRSRTDSGKVKAFATGIRESDRVKQSVKEKTEDELLDHYMLAQGDLLTNLGVLCVGLQRDRARLGTAPIVQFIKRDEFGNKANKLYWDDYSLSPTELIEAVWREIPDFRERYELPDGLFRQYLPAYDEVVIRELLVNALVHRPYTQRGDIFLNLYPDRLEVVNPGLLPLGVTPANILHVTVRRNEHLARVFHDLKLMEREGSGFDRIYEVLLSQGRPIPEIREGTDRVEVTVRRRIVQPRVADFITKTDQAYQLSQRERISLGLLAQHDALTARELCRLLELPSVDGLHVWLGRLPEWGLVQSSGRTQATRYFVSPGILRRMDFSAATTLRRIEPHRLRALILEDLRRYPNSAIGDVNRRIGPEIPYKQAKRALDRLIAERKVIYEGERRGRRYRLPE